MFDLSDVLVFFIFVVFCMLWWNAQGVKPIALAATKNYCKKMDLQLLDEGVALKGFWFKRNSQGRVCLWRSYHFEFASTGDERYSGIIVLLGRSVESIKLDPHRLN